MSHAISLLDIVFASRALLGLNAINVNRCTMDSALMDANVCKTLPLAVRNISFSQLFRLPLHILSMFGILSFGLGIGGVS